MMHLNIGFTEQILIKEMATWMDGGSITLYCENIHGQEFVIHFVQNVQWDILKFEKLPGRIYLDGNLIPQRSELEKKLIQGLCNCKFVKASDLDSRILKEQMDYLKSEQYILDPKRIQIIKRS